MLRMKSLLLGVSMPREASRANQLESMNDPLSRAVSRRSSAKDTKPKGEEKKTQRTFCRRAMNDTRSAEGSPNPNIADRTCTTVASASDS